MFKLLHCLVMAGIASARPGAHSNQHVFTGDIAKEKHIHNKAAAH